MAQRTRGRSRRRGWRAGVALAVAAAVAVGAVVIWRAGGMTDGAELVEHRAEASFDDAEAATVPRDAPVGTDNGATQDPATLVVDVDGAVMSPGVYELAAEGARVRDAIAAAGGLAEDADTTQLNLATLLQDGQKVHVPRMGEAPSASPTTDTAGRTNAAPSGSSGSTAPININTAGEEELKQLPGVGDATAAAIVRDRREHGRFASVDDLMRVSGIGQKKLEKLRPRICV
ncbi:comEA protein [Olsenella profusa F0195]|uniref:ComEA protein n=1 Tax=Olsenella profusa F0195 TaxID=1125712 RepID=U2UVN3_9ACTN|nr:comEA protein [Olsenella profusa F0195]